MPSVPSHPPLLDEAHADFISHHVSILVASCDAAHLPSLARAYGCRVSDDRHQLTLFLSVARSTALLRDVRAGGAVAVVFSRPSTHATLQLKGSDAVIVPLEDGDRARMQQHGRTFIEDIRQLGFRDPFASAMMTAVNEEAVGVRFTPAAAFIQTPGPQAGQRLGAPP